MWIDTHCHLEAAEFAGEEDVIARHAAELGVAQIVIPSVDRASFSSVSTLAGRHPNCSYALGIHPMYVPKASDEDLDVLRAAIEASMPDPRLVAIGEIGLDYYYDFSPKPLQKEWFAVQIEFAREMGLPIIVHNRDSHQDVMDILKASKAREAGGVFHCFSGSVEMARELLDLNFYISIGGIVTFKNARKVKEVVEYISEDRLLIETDCPYLAPEPYRGSSQRHYHPQKRRFRTK
jgi:TatD DNase family protein